MQQLFSCSSQRHLQKLIYHWQQCNLNGEHTIKLGFPQDLDLPDVDIVEWVDAVTGLLNVVGNAVGEEFVDHLFQVIVLAFLCDDVDHPVPDPSDLLCLGVGSLLDLVLSLLGEADAEDAEKVTVGGLQVHTGIDQGLVRTVKGRHQIQCRQQ